MNRTEWKAFHSRIRTDARDFHAKHGGFECFRALFDANGKEWMITRRRDRTSQQTDLRTTRIPDRTDSQLAAHYLHEAGEDRRMANRRSWNAEARKKASRAATEYTRSLRKDPAWRERARADARAAA